MVVGARSLLGVGLALLLTEPAWGQPGDAGPEPLPQPAQTGAAPTPLPPAAPGGSLSSDRLMAGPSLRETGRIAATPVPMPSTAIENSLDTPGVSKEKSITPAASSIAVAPTRPHGVMDPRVLDREIGEHFADIAGCRVEVARAKQVTPPQIVADEILLRWTIDSDGSISSTEVVAIAPVDMGVMDCAKRTMSQWTFSRPRGGPVTVERKFKFASAIPGER